MKRLLPLLLIAVILLLALSGCTVHKPSAERKPPEVTGGDLPSQPSALSGDQTEKTSGYLTEENGLYTLTLPKSKETIELREEEVRFVPDIKASLVEIAEEKLTFQISEYSNHSGFYLQVNEDHLCLSVEVIKDIDPPATVGAAGEYIAGGCGIDHEHLFFSEPISA